MYGYDPCNGLNEQECSHIVGGEVCMWGEHVDEQNIDSIVFPRACAVGERLWSASSVIDTTDAHDRLLIQRCRLVQRGIRSSPVEPGFCSTTYV
jgi:hexosaminidase